MAAKEVLKAEVKAAKEAATQEKADVATKQGKPRRPLPRRLRRKLTPRQTSMRGSATS